MARESYESRQRRAQRLQDPVMNTAWLSTATPLLAGVKEIRLNDAIVVENGWTEQHLRMLTKHGYLLMSSEWTDTEPTAHVPSGKKFKGYVWEVVA